MNPAQNPFIQVLSPFQHSLAQSSLKIKTVFLKDTAAARVADEDPRFQSMQFQLFKSDCCQLANGFGPMPTALKLRSNPQPYVAGGVRFIGGNVSRSDRRALMNDCE